MSDFVVTALRGITLSISMMIVFVNGGLLASFIIAFLICKVSKKYRDGILEKPKTPPMHSIEKKEIVLDFLGKFVNDGYFTLWIICLIIMAVVYGVFGQILEDKEANLLVTACISLIFPVALAVNCYVEAFASVTGGLLYWLIDRIDDLPEKISEYLYIFALSVQLLLLIIVLIKHYKKNSIQKVRNDLYYWVPINNLIKRDDYEIIHELEKRIASYQASKAKFDAVEYVTLEGREIDRWYKKGLAKIKRWLFISDMVVLVCFWANGSMFQRIYVGVCSTIVLVMLLYEGNAEGVFSRLVIGFIYSRWGYHVKYESNEKFIGSGQISWISKIRKRVNLLCDIIAILRILAFKDKYEKTSLLELAYSTISRGAEASEKDEFGRYLPLLVLSMFYYWCNDALSDDIKADLSTVLQKHRFESLIFMQSLWCYLWCKEVEKDGGNYVKQIAALCS